MALPSIRLPNLSSLAACYVTPDCLLAKDPPTMVPWGEMQEGDKEKGRERVRAIPCIMREVAEHVYRVE